MLKRDLYYERIPTKSLRDDVRYLGNILGRVIKKQEGESFFRDCLLDFNVANNVSGWQREMPVSRCWCAA